MVDDLGDYDVTPVEGNPFGSMASSPNDYDVSPVDHDPFAGAGENPAPDQFELASRQPEATPSSAGRPPLDPGDRDLLIKTVFGEASGEPPLGQAGIAHAILNRVRAGDYGSGIAGVVKAPAAGLNPRLGYHEFSPWNTGRATEGNPTAQHLSPDNPNPVLARAYRNIGDVVDKAYSGLIPDPTGGATHYYGRMRGHPSWSPPLAAQNQVRIGGTTFVGREHGPGEIASQTASGYAGGGPVQLNADLRRRLSMITRPRFAEGGAPDDDPLGSSVTMASDQTADAPIAYTPEDIDQPGPMTETLAHYAGNPAHAMPMRVGAAIGEEAKRMGQGLWSAATVPGDVATGKASMADPETQQRVTSLAASLPGGGPEAALGARGPVGAAAKAVKSAPATRELNVWNPTTGLWEGPKPTLNPPEGVHYDPMFNFDPALMNKVPDVPQFELQRYDPPRGVSDRMRDLVTNSDVRAQMIGIVRNGMQTVGLSWYNTGQLRAMFLKELGDDAGQQAFEKYMNLVSATSPENKIPQNIRTASYFYERDAAGVPPPERGDPIAQPYGSKAQKLHQQNVGNVLTEGYDVLKNPKPPSFVQNLMGNYAPGTMDRHAFKLPAILSRDPRFLETSFTPEKGVEPVRPQRMFQNGELSIDDAVNQPTMWAGMPNKNEYAALEGWYKSIGDELGITPAQVQASAWVGGGHITGLASAADETFLHSFQGRVFNTAHHTGQTPSEVVKRMIRGEQPLLSGGPGMAPTAAQTSTAGAGGSPPPPSDQAEPGHPFY
jgi:spore germination cell wall hydrolase CwlJ-like protein